MSELKVNTINPSSGTSLQFPVATQVVVGNTGNSTVLVVSSATAENLGALNGDYHLYTTDGVVKSVYGWKSNSVSEALGTVSAHPLNLITNNTARMTISGGGAGDITLNNSQLIFDKPGGGNTVTIPGINFVTNPQWNAWVRGIQWSLGNAATADGAGIGVYGVNGLTANRISIGFNPGPWNETANSLHVTQNGSVGIGVASPASKLHVKGKENAGLLRLETTDAIASAGACYLGLHGSAGRGGYLGFGGSNNTLDIWNDLAGPTRFGTSNLERMRIDSAGNVGIGETSPTVKVDLGNYFINSTSPTGADQTSHIRLYKSGENRYGFGISTNALNIAANQPTGTIRLYTNSLERMRIDSSGRIGVKTDTPSEIITVRDNNPVLNLLNTDTAGNAGGSLRFGHEQGSGAGMTGAIAVIKAFLTDGSATNRAGDLAFFTSNDGTLAERMRIASSGDVTVTGNLSSGNLSSGNVTVTGNLTVSGTITSPQCVMTSTGTTASYPVTGKNAGSSRVGTNIALLNTNITPRSASSKILVNFSFCGETTAVGDNSAFYITRTIGSTETEIGSAPYPGNIYQPWGIRPVVYDNNPASTMSNYHIMFLDSPSTALQVTYKLYYYGTNTSSTYTFFLNRTINDNTDSVNGYVCERGSSQCILQEYFA
jgi:hypothetical protein